MREVWACMWVSLWAAAAAVEWADVGVLLSGVNTISSNDVDHPHLNVTSAEQRWWHDGSVVPRQEVATKDISNLKAQMRIKRRPYLRRDPIEMAGLLEGDILPAPTHTNSPNMKEAQEKNAVVDTGRLWPGGVVPYQFSPEFTLLPLERYLIRHVMADISASSCATFRERTSEPDFIKIIFDQQRCYSHIGRMGGVQPVSLGIFCVNWWDLSTVYHELFHTLGFYHEHNRPDRDSFIEIKWNNIAEGRIQNFIKRTQSSSELTDMPYDLTSVMHYSPYAFGKWSFLTPTIKSRRRGYGFHRPRKPSKIDYRKLNRLYSCQRNTKLLPSFTIHQRPTHMPDKIARQKSMVVSGVKLFNNCGKTTDN
ncbi:Zinc metalloproteinase nas-7-like [Homarus americanus]|uniref:Metalloendopeptidase n=1 Tax=Homarus americanus TaxID=6706 RepID=A0A8J5MYC6_HOMAM|nr:Zinc metalloproteinase nas-7-like [Homarus americanus]